MQTITVEQLKARLDNGEKPHLLDVREPHEHMEFNIGGKLYPVGQIQTMQVEALEDWKNDEIIIYCRTGNRSGMACLVLDQLGFKNTKNLVGGMVDWQKKFGN